MLLDRRLQNPKMSCKTNRVVAPATKASTSSIVQLWLGPGAGAVAGCFSAQSGYRHLLESMSKFGSEQRNKSHYRWSVYVRGLEQLVGPSSRM